MVFGGWGVLGYQIRQVSRLARPRKAAISLSEAAAQRIKDLLGKREKVWWKLSCVLYACTFGDSSCW